MWNNFKIKRVRWEIIMFLSFCWKIHLYVLNTRLRAASGGPRSPFGVKEEFKEARGIQEGKFFKNFFFKFFFWGQRSNLVKNRKFCNWLEMVPNMLFWHETSFKVEKNWKIKFSKFFINVPPRPPAFGVFLVKISKILNFVGNGPKHVVLRWNEF